MADSLNNIIDTLLAQTGTPVTLKANVVVLKDGQKVLQPLSYIGTLPQESGSPTSIPALQRFATNRVGKDAVYALTSAKYILWASEHAAQSYPFVDTTGGSNIAKDFILDLSLLIPPNIVIPEDAWFFISSIKVLQTSILVDVSYHSGDDDVLCGRFSGISRQLSIYSSLITSNYYLLTATAQEDADYKWLSKLAGKIFMGNTSIYGIGQITLTSATGMLNAMCVHQTSFGGVTSIQCNGELLIGDILLLAGDGIKLLVIGNTITVSVDYPAIYSGLQSVDDAVSAITKLLGLPIKSINGIVPDEAGNIQIKGLDCVNVAKIARGALSVSDTCSKPCCTLATSDILSNLDVLLRLHLTLKNYFTLTASNINFMQANLATLLGSK